MLESAQNGWLFFALQGGYSCVPYMWTEGAGRFSLTRGDYQCCLPANGGHRYYLVNQVQHL